MELFFYIDIKHPNNFVETYFYFLKTANLEKLFFFIEEKNLLNPIILLKFTFYITYSLR